MNIFYLDNDPVKSAEYMCDRHVVKMVTESAQILSTAHRVLDGVKTLVTENGRTRYTYKLDGMPEYILYQATHINHPSVKWALEASSNYQWLYHHYKAIGLEYEYRYNKEHGAYNPFLVYYLSLLPSNITTADFSTPPMVMPLEFQSNDVVGSYREYYRKEKIPSGVAYWKRNREIPSVFY